MVEQRGQDQGRQLAPWERVQLEAERAITEHLAPMNGDPVVAPDLISVISESFSASQVWREYYDDNFPRPHVREFVASALWKLLKAKTLDYAEGMCVYLKTPPQAEG